MADGSVKDIRSEILAEANRATSGKRGQHYGPPERNFTRIAALWNAYLSLRAERRGGWGEIEPLDVAAMMRLIKEARLIEDPTHRDSYVDIVGYAVCGAEIALAQPAAAQPEPWAFNAPEPQNANR